MSDHRTLSRDLTALGPFFAVEIHLPGQSAPPPWQSMTSLIEDSAALEARVQAVRAALAHRVRTRPEHIAIRVAASVAQLGLIARLLAPAIGASALGHPPISPAADDLWWQDHLGGPYPLSVAPAAATPTPPLGPAVAAITETIAERYRVSEQVVWGNIGSAANSAAQLISTTRPELTTTAHAAADSVLQDARVDQGILRAGPGFRRLSCCLIYRIADDGATICGDCILG
ncbi:MAG: (2Fe-2S)-binding protein [Mycobacterium sp.]|nr:(2Fe-2S)-binding protein [Mycobacterium sp.]